MEIVGNTLLGMAGGSLLVAAYLGDNFALSGRAYYSVIAGLVWGGAILSIFH